MMADHNPFLATRRARVSSLVDMGLGKGLEIGALDSPVALRSVCRVRYIDVLDTASLREHYRHDPNVDGDGLVEVDYALYDEQGTIHPLREVVQDGAPFDWVVASHVIEHVPDLIRWLADISEVMADDGHLLLVIPDRRYTFDAIRPQTTVGQILQAHTLEETIPSERAVYDYVRSVVSVSAPEIWSGRSASTDARMNSLELAAEVRQKVLQTAEYFDCHVWMFTPESFVEQIDELGRLGLCDFVVESVIPTAVGELEFYAALKRLSRGLTTEQVAAQREGSLRRFTDAPTVTTNADRSTGAPSRSLEVSDRERRLIELKRRTMTRFRRLRQ